MADLYYARNHKNNDKKTVLTLTRILQVFILQLYKVGLLTHPVCCAFPAIRQWQRMQQTKLRSGVGIHSNRNCSGFAPDSLFTFQPANAASRLLVHRKCMWYLLNRKTILRFFFFLYALYRRYKYFLKLDSNGYGSSLIFQFSAIILFLHLIYMYERKDEYPNHQCWFAKPRCCLANQHCGLAKHHRWFSFSSAYF